MEVFSWIMIGLVIGSFARFAMPGPAARGMPVAVVIGLPGALIGGFLGSIFLMESSAPFDCNSLMMAANGAIYPLFTYLSVHGDASTKERFMVSVMTQRAVDSPRSEFNEQDAPMPFGAYVPAIQTGNLLIRGAAPREKQEVTLAE
jgi:uncharacterized membrane protein YeaQ/YmgE (transglycosylase-associated protein family)